MYLDVVRILPCSSSILSTEISREGGHERHQDKDLEFLLLLVSTNDTLHNSITDLVLDDVVFLIISCSNFLSYKNTKVSAFETQ